MYDDLGRPVALGDPRDGGPRRVVSLVPSLTEALAVSGVPLAGVTDWCTHPPDVVARLPRVGGTKYPRLPDVLALAPDLVVGNAEENRADDLDALRAAGVPVWVTAPSRVATALVSLDRLLGACAVPRPGWLDDAVAAWSQPPAGLGQRAVCFIWRRPWMVLGRDTFAGDVLSRLGCDNVFGEHAERYPRVSLDDVRAAAPDLVVLPDEPYAFGPADLDAFTGWSVPVAFVSGRHLTWYGPSLVTARDVLAGQLAAARPA